MFSLFFCLELFESLWQNAVFFYLIFVCSSLKVSCGKVIFPNQVMIKIIFVYI